MTVMSPVENVPSLPSRIGSSELLNPTAHSNPSFTTSIANTFTSSVPPGPSVYGNHPIASSSSLMPPYANYGSYSGMPYGSNPTYRSPFSSYPPYPYSSYPAASGFEGNFISGRFDSMISNVTGLLHMIDSTYYASLNSFSTIVHLFEQLKWVTSKFSNGLDGLFEWLKRQSWILFYAIQKLGLGSRSRAGPVMSSSHDTKLVSSTQLASLRFGEKKQNGTWFENSMKTLCMLAIIISALKLLKNVISAHRSSSQSRLADAYVDMEPPVFAKILYSYDPSTLDSSSSDLPLTKGELVAILKAPSSHCQNTIDVAQVVKSHETCATELSSDALLTRPTWLVGRLKDGRIGFFPSNYCQLIESKK